MSKFRRDWPWWGPAVAFLAERFPPFQRWFVRRQINSHLRATRTRPHPLTLWHESAHAPPCTTCPPSATATASAVVDAGVTDYCCWPTLTDTRFTARHLPPATAPEDQPHLPDPESAAKLFVRGVFRPAERTSLLFMAFAQWFTDGFLRTHPDDFRWNTSNHAIDLCQIYGLREETSRILRSYRFGQLLSQEIEGEEYPPYLYGADGEPHPRFRGLHYLPDMPRVLRRSSRSAQTKHTIFATGLERGSATLGFSLMCTLFLREHNRVALLLHEANPGWNDERLFQTTRNVMIVRLLKIVLEEYIGHLSPSPVPIRFEEGFAEGERWYRPNWMSIEFNLLYRWHSLVPDHIRISGVPYPTQDLQFDNSVLTSRGVGGVLEDLSAQPAGRICLLNTPSFLLAADAAAMKLARKARLRPYGQYRKFFGLDREIASYRELCPTDSETQAVLEGLYPDIERLEFLPGILAEEGGRGTMFGSLLARMVAVDAFSHALTNPLLAEHVFEKETFSARGWDLIHETACLADLARAVAPSASRVTFELA